MRKELFGPRAHDLESASRLELTVPEFATSRRVNVGGLLRICRSDYQSISDSGGSNPAIVWTSSLPESEGIHVHAEYVLRLPFRLTRPMVLWRSTGCDFDPELVRLLMIQLTIPSLRSLVSVSLMCPCCGTPHVDRGVAAFDPLITCSFVAHARLPSQVRDAGTLLAIPSSRCCRPWMPSFLPVDESDGRMSWGR